MEITSNEKWLELHSAFRTFQKLLNQFWSEAKLEN